VSQICDEKKLTPVCNFAHIAEKPVSRKYYRLLATKKKINMKTEISESFKHKLDLHAGLKSGSFLTVKTPRLNYDNHPLILFREIKHFFLKIIISGRNAKFLNVKANGISCRTFDRFV